MHYHGLKQCCLEHRHSKTAFKNHIKFFHSRVIRKSKIVKIGGSNNGVTSSPSVTPTWTYRKHTCDSCQKWFKTDNELTIHVLSFHRRLIRQQACCHGKLSRESFIHHHIQCHSDLPKAQKVAILKEIHVFLCLKCPQQFYRKEDLQNHEDLVHSSVTQVTPTDTSVTQVTPTATNETQVTPIITNVTQVTPNTTSVTEEIETPDDKIKEEIIENEEIEGPSLQLSEPMTIPQEAYVSLPEMNESEMLNDQENVDPESKKRKIEDDFAYSKRQKDCGKPEKLLKCSKCSRKFILEKNLKIHMTISH